jgi:acyl dehydratase
MTYNHEAAKIDPRLKDGLYHGPSSGHINPAKAEKVGMGGAYGYGASMGAWFHDYVAYWAGHDGYIWHSKTQFRSPPFEGDVTYVDGEVSQRTDDSAHGFPLVQVKVRMVTQEGQTILTGVADVALPY